MMGHLASYFDYEAYARDLFIDDYYFTNGYVFRRG
jgi:antirestriction protein